MFGSNPDTFSRFSPVSWFLSTLRWPWVWVVWTVRVVVCASRCLCLGVWTCDGLEILIICWDWLQENEAVEKTRSDSRSVRSGSVWQWQDRTDDHCRSITSLGTGLMKPVWVPVHPSYWQSVLVLRFRVHTVQQYYSTLVWSRVRFYKRKVLIMFDKDLNRKVNVWVFI